ncbi:hydroxysqualene dehydroxylase HpnE [Candidatus Bipolaricaulota bacterium]|nr:hydroxysqualene dehydroxylase HpnE [Candidatus Bipolaricaulota bacterium]
MKPVVIIGGGAAGIAAACTLAERGKRILLLERAPRLGGRAASFFHHRMRQEVDYGYHILMRCCTETIDLVHQLGMERSVSFQERLAIPIACGSKRSLLSSAPLPGPLHLLPSLMRYRPLSYRERIAVMRAGLFLLVHDPQKDRTFADWLRCHGQKKNAIARLWDPICIATLNERVESVSARAAGMVFKKGFLKPHGADLGLFTVPLSHLFSRAISFLAERGGEVLLNAQVAQILIERGAARGVKLVSGERIDSDCVIAAVPPYDLLSLLPQAVAENGYFARAKEIRFSPIVNLHLWFDRPVMEEPFLVVIDSPMQAVFDVSRIQGKEGPTHVVLSQSAARDLINRPNEEIRNQLLAALEELFPAVRTAKFLDALVIRHPRATFLPTPGSEALRPEAKTPINGLFLAGDYTATGWPSTIEGAVRSGRNAAAKLATR